MTLPLTPNSPPSPGSEWTCGAKSGPATGPYGAPQPDMGPALSSNSIELPCVSAFVLAHRSLPVPALCRCTAAAPLWHRCNSVPRR
uniref:Uncharacterized protein n=1 Tax=Oryza barthii TaxID=65489 RepID=A0A0D3FVX0_9ORYZ